MALNGEWQSVRGGKRIWENISKKDKIIDELKKDLESFKKERIVLLEDSEKLYKLYHSE